MHELIIGRRVIQFNLRLGIIDKGTLRSRPFMGYVGSDKPVHSSQRMSLVVKFEAPHGTITNMSLADMGVVPYDLGNWNGTNFTVYARDRHLLPEPQLDADGLRATRNRVSSRYSEPLG